MAKVCVSLGVLRLQIAETQTRRCTDTQTRRQTTHTQTHTHEHAHTKAAAILPAEALDVRLHARQVIGRWALIDREGIDCASVCKQLARILMFLWGKQSPCSWMSAFLLIKPAFWLRWHVSWVSPCEPLGGTRLRTSGDLELILTPFFRPPDPILAMP